MPEIKVVLYSDNRVPRSLAVDTRTIYRTALTGVVVAILGMLSLGLALRLYILNRTRFAQTSATAVSSADQAMGPSNTLEDQNRSLRDQLDLLRAQLQNAAATARAPREIDKTNPALALFSPVVVDKSQKQTQIAIQNLKFVRGSGKSPSAVTFELHNAHPGDSTEKGYIVVLARRPAGIAAYPNIFRDSGPYLLDFEKGETFQVARFRMVNAEFDSAVDAKNFQILIFTRTGELLINTLFEAK